MVKNEMRLLLQMTSVLSIIRSRELGPVRSIPRTWFSSNQNQVNSFIFLQSHSPSSFQTMPG